MQKKSLETIVYSTAGIIVMLVIVVALNGIKDFTMGQAAA